jgi:thioredoxin reductase (NADPH)
MPERPVIIVVDDEPDSLAAMLDALTRRFGGDYRVVPHLSARAALVAVTKIKEEKEEIALIIADQRMPEMTGREFFGQVRSVVPTAKRALIVDWGDHEASSTILQACALGELDNYLYKPWTPRRGAFISADQRVLGGMDSGSSARDGADPHCG